MIEQICARLPSPIYEKEPEPEAWLQGYKQFRILCALRQGPFGVDALNRQIIAHFEAQLRPSNWMAIPILITQNDLKRQLYNGAMGVLIRQGFDSQATAYFFEGECIRAIREGALPNYEVTFCLSVHKSQGSEFEEVLVLCPPGSERFGKEALYTAVTRAKRKATLMGDSSTFVQALATPTGKRSGFTERFLKLRN